MKHDAKDDVEKRNQTLVKSWNVNPPFHNNLLQLCSAILWSFLCKVLSSLYALKLQVIQGAMKKQKAKNNNYHKLEPGT